MTDLVERLRRYSHGCILDRLDPDFADAVLEAADEIEELRKDRGVMDAVKFLEEKDRMCRFFAQDNCVGCPFNESVHGVTNSCCAFKERLWLTEDYVSSVLNWSNLHPMKTRAAKFEEVFGFPPYVLVDGREDMPSFDWALTNLEWWGQQYCNELLQEEHR